MSTSDTLVALQLPQDFAGRLTALIGQFVSVYLMHVHAPSIIGEPKLCPPYPAAPAPAPAPAPPVTPSPGQGSSWGGPPLTPGIPPGGGHVGPIPMAAWCGPGGPAPEMRGTAVVVGTLAYVGSDYIVVRIPAGETCQDILIPFGAIGQVVPGRVTL